MFLPFLTWWSASPTPTLEAQICPPKVFEKFRSLNIADIGISSITVAELEYGVCKSQQQEKNRSALMQFLIPLEVVEFNHAAATVYGIIRSDSEKRGVVIGSLDRLIAAHAVSLDVTLVSNNLREFSRISSLSVENWTEF